MDKKDMTLITHKVLTKVANKRERLIEKYRKISHDNAVNINIDTSSLIRNMLITAPDNPKLGKYLEGYGSDGLTAIATKITEKALQTIESGSLKEGVSAIDSVLKYSLESPANKVEVNSKNFNINLNGEQFQSQMEIMKKMKDANNA